MPSPDPRGVTLRDLRVIDEFRAVVALEQQVWGAEATRDVVSVPMFVATVKCGAILIGAFTPAGEMVGFVYSFPGLSRGQVMQWSHMLGVVESHRGRGVGYALKRAQRERALAQGLELIEWTYDPLQAVNAHFNVTRLGAVVEEYAENVYGTSESPLHRGAPTDRFVAEWHLNAPHVERRLGDTTGVRVRGADVGTAVPLTTVAADGRWTRLTATTDPDTPHERLLVDVPADYTAMLADAPALALEWRLATRSVFTRCFGLAYRVVDFLFDRDSRRGQYLLARAPAGGSR
jgi:predicted GNAT superfamily acetyltransferase